MVGGPAWQQGQALLADLDPGAVDLGLHLDLTEHPLTTAAMGLRALLARAYTGQLDRTAIRREIAAQLDAFEQALGRPPDYVDGHQHVHQLPGLRDDLIAALQQRSGQHRPWLRHTGAPRRAVGMAAHGGWRSTLKPRVIQALGANGLALAAARAGFKQNHGLLGVYEFSDQATPYTARLQAWLDDCRQADLLMCHPSLEPIAGDPVGSARQTEYALLSSAGFGATLRAQAVVLAPMSRILCGPYDLAH